MQKENSKYLKTSPPLIQFAFYYSLEMQQDKQLRNMQRLRYTHRMKQPYHRKHITS